MDIALAIVASASRQSLIERMQTLSLAATMCVLMIGIVWLKDAIKKPSRKKSIF